MGAILLLASACGEPAQESCDDGFVDGVAEALSDGGNINADNLSALQKVRAAMGCAHCISVSLTMNCILRLPVLFVAETCPVSDGG